MAKIENISVYPTVTPAASDLLIATDVSNDNKTVTFLVSDITGGGGGVSQDLQNVLDTGNTATGNINLTGNVVVTGTLQSTTITADGSIGTAGQVLSSTGSGLVWINSSESSCCPLQEVLDAGNISTTEMILEGVRYRTNGVGGGVFIASPATLEVVGTSNFEGEVTIYSTDLIFDYGVGTEAGINAGGTIGTAGQFLTSTGTTIAWSDTLPAAAIPTIQEVLASGNTANSIGISFTGTSTISLAAGAGLNSLGTNTWGGSNTFSSLGTTVSTSAISLTGSLWDGTSTGTPGQVLSSTNTGVQWVTSPAGTQNLQSVLDNGGSAAGDITISGNFTAGAIIDTSLSSGSSGQVLSSTGSGLAWISTTCCNLDDTLSVGATSASNITLTGNAEFTAPTIIPTQIEDSLGNTGAAGQALIIDGAGNGILWATPTGVNTTYSYSVPSSTTTLRLTDSNATNYDVSLTAGAGIDITRDSSSQLTISNNRLGTYMVNKKFKGSEVDFDSNNGSWMTYGNYLQGGFATAGESIMFNRNTAPSDSFWLAHEVQGGIIVSNGNGNESCDSLTSEQTLCSAHITWISSEDATYDFSLWIVDACDNDTYTPVEVANIPIETTALETYCVSMELLTVPVLSGTKSLMFTMRNTTAASSSVNFQGQLSMRMKWG